VTARLGARSCQGVTGGLLRQLDWPLANDRPASGQDEPHQGADPQARRGPRGKALADASRKRPYRIALVDLGGRSRVNLKSLVKTLNKHVGNLFEFEVSTPAVTKLGEHDDEHCYSDARLFGFLKERIAHTDWDFAIGVTHARLHGDCFNRHNESEGVGVVTVADANEYLAPGKSIQQYLCYLILCEAFCVVGGVQFEHEEVWYCLFDWCDQKEDLILCLEEPCIRECCLRRVQDSGFSEDDLQEANRLLKYVGATNRLDIIAQAVQNPASLLLMGGLVGHILRGAFSDAPSLVVWGVVAALALLIGLCAWVKYVLEKRRRTEYGIHRQ